MKAQQENLEFEGLPYRGVVYDFKNNDKDEYKPVKKYDAKARIFDLSKEEHVKEYEDIWKKHLEGRTLIGVEERNFDPVKCTYFIFIRWTEMYYTNPPLEILKKIEAQVKPPPEQKKPNV